MNQVDKLDRTKLNEFSAKLLDVFLNGFPNETIFSIENSEDVFEADGDRFVGAWVIHWLCPAGGEYWNAWLESTQEQVVLRWGSDHQHFFPFLEGFPQDEVQSCLDTLKEIFDEKLVSIDFYDNRRKYPHAGGTWCPPEKIDTFRNKQGISSYEVKSWRGTYDRTIEL